MSNTTVTDNSDINDIRNTTHFRGVSFSNFKKNEVRAQYVQNMKKGKIEPACYWCAELICAGHYGELWETILHFVAKYIHLGNPKLVIYLERRFHIFRNIVSQDHLINELQLRNQNNIRKLFAEVTTILCMSSKKPSIEPVKINRAEEFDITQMTDRLKAPSIEYISNIFLPKDPKELMIPLNEFAYNVSFDCKNMATACYWIEWTMEFEVICRKRKEPCVCVSRTEYNIDRKYSTDIIWMIWDVLLEYSNKTNDSYIIQIMNSLVDLFCIKYTQGTPKKRRYLLYFAVSLLTETVPRNIEIVEDKITVYSVMEQINQIYKQIRKNQVTPGTDYLFTDLDSSKEFEETLHKMEAMNYMMNL
jgi:hypothetical protein